VAGLTFVGTLFLGGSAANSGINEVNKTAQTLWTKKSTNFDEIDIKYLFQFFKKSSRGLTEEGQNPLPSYFNENTTPILDYGVFNFMLLANSHRAAGCFRVPLGI